jgi:hypothetical protein
MLAKSCKLLLLSFGSLDVCAMNVSLWIQPIVRDADGGENREAKDKDGANNGREKPLPAFNGALVATESS